MTHAAYRRLTRRPRSGPVVIPIPERGFPKDALEAADRCEVGVVDGAFEYRMAALSDDARGDVEEALAAQE